MFETVKLNKKISFLTIVALLVMITSVWVFADSDPTATWPNPTFYNYAITSPGGVVPYYVEGNTPNSMSGYFFTKISDTDSLDDLPASVTEKSVTYQLNDSDSNTWIKIKYAKKSPVSGMQSSWYVKTWTSSGIDIGIIMMKGSNGYLKYAYGSVLSTDGNLWTPATGKFDRDMKLGKNGCNISGISHISIFYKKQPTTTTTTTTVATTTEATTTEGTTTEATTTEATTTEGTTTEATTTEGTTTEATTTEGTTTEATTTEATTTEGTTTDATTTEGTTTEATTTEGTTTEATTTEATTTTAPTTVGATTTTTAGTTTTDPTTVGATTTTTLETLATVSETLPLSSGSGLVLSQTSGSTTTNGTSAATTAETLSAQNDEIPQTGETTTYAWIGLVLLVLAGAMGFVIYRVQSRK